MTGKTDQPTVDAEIARLARQLRATEEQMEVFREERDAARSELGTLRREYRRRDETARDMYDVAAQRTEERDALLTEANNLRQRRWGTANPIRLALVHLGNDVDKGNEGRKIYPPVEVCIPVVPRIGEHIFVGAWVATVVVEQLVWHFDGDEPCVTANVEDPDRYDGGVLDDREMAIRDRNRCIAAHGLTEHRQWAKIRDLEMRVALLDILFTVGKANPDMSLVEALAEATEELMRRET